MQTELWRSLGQTLLDLLYPPRCEICGTLGPEAFCERCWEEILWQEPPECWLCGGLLPRSSWPAELCGDCQRQKRYFDGARTAGLHVGTLRQAILQFKFHNRRRLVESLAQILAARWAKEPLGEGWTIRQADCLVPIPLHPRRRSWRGFDQALLLSQALSPLIGLPVVVGLARVRYTTPQIDLPPEEREENMRGAFSAVGDCLQSRRVLLIDDVYTTGATANQAAKAAKEGGARAVYVLTISRPAPPWHPAATSWTKGEP